LERPEISLLEETEYRNKMATELHSLHSALDKIAFWYDDLNLNWLDLQDADAFKGVPLEEFKFSVQDSEKGAINRWIMDNYLRLSDDPRKNEKYLDLDCLRAEFEKRLKAATNVKQAVQKELKRVDSLFEKSYLRDHKSVGSRRSPFEIQAYHDYVDYHIEPDYEELDPTVELVLRTRNAVVLARHRIYVENRLEARENNHVKETSLTLHQITLMFEYCGIWDALECTASEKARLFEDFIPSDSPKRIYDSIREAGAKKRRNREDLEAVLEFMERKNIKSFQEKLKSHLKSAPKRLF